MRGPTLNLALLAAVLIAFAGCTRSDTELGAVERLNAEPGKLGRFTFAYYTALRSLPDGGAIAVYMKDGGDYRPLVYRRATGATGPFDAEVYLSPEDMRAMISIVPSLAPGDTPDDLYAIWQARQPKSGDKSVVFRSSTDRGAAWGEARTINSRPSAFIPAMASDGKGGVFVVWTDERSDGIRVFFNRSLDHGATWLAEDMRIDGTEGMRGTALNVSIAADVRGRVVVAWADQARREGRHIRVVSSEDRGATWSPSVRVDDGEKRLSPSDASVVFAGDRVVLVWAATTTNVAAQVWGDVSADGGKTWGDDVLLHESVQGIAPRVHLVSDGERAHAVFHAGPLRGDWQIFYAVTDASGGWSKRGDDLPRIVQGQGHFANPRIARDDARGLVVVCEDDGRRVLLTRSTDGGASWSTPPLAVTEVSPGGETGRIRYPQVAASSGVAYVMWELWSDPAAIIKNLADANKKVAPADLFVRRLTFR